MKEEIIDHLVIEIKNVTQTIKKFQSIFFNKKSMD